MGRAGRLKWRGCCNTVAALLGARGRRPRKIVRVEQRICVVRTDAMSMGASRAFAWTGRLVEAILRDVQESQYGKEN